VGSVGAPEILVILVLALIVLGPERLPQAARTMGRWVGEVRRVTGSLQAEVKDVVDEVMRPVNETATVATESFTSTFNSSDAPDGTAAIDPEPTTAAASASEASSDPLPAEPLAADVPLPGAPEAASVAEAPPARPAFPAPPVDPSLN
jgi:sec-independent protein translocase protein TatB